MANAEKVAAVAELTERFQTSSGAVLANYRGLTVAQLAELRRVLNEHANFAVVKNTLTKIAATEAGVADQLGDLLTGPSAIAFVKGDVVEAAKGLREFAKANPALEIKGGIIDRLADLESRDVLLAMLAGAMKASMARAAATMAALPTQMARLAAALEAKRAAEEAPATEAPAAETAAPAAEAAASPDNSTPNEDAAADVAAQATTEDATED
jgi:large subunit ribosomal protein L10